MPETINVLVTPKLDIEAEEPVLLSRIEDVSSRIHVIHRPTRSLDEVRDTLNEVDVIFTGDVLPLPAEAPRLRWVQIHWAGVDHVVEHPLYLETDVRFTNASGVHAINMGEYALTMMLAFAHRVPAMIEDMKAGTWPEERWPRYLPNELRGSTLGVVGYGSIGREAARLASTFGMKVLAIKRNIRKLADLDSFTVAGTGDPQGEIPDRYYPVEALHSFLGECDYVLLTVPLTEATHHMLDAEALSAMKPSAVLINVARGDVVDEEALVQALKTGEIGGAALDVFSIEPLPDESPLWQLDNVILSPHIAGNTPHYNERSVDLFCENLGRFLNKEQLLNEIDRRYNY